MADINPKTGDIVSFQLVVGGINGDERVQVKVASGTMNYQTALLIDQQLNVKHTSLFPYFRDKVGGVDDPDRYLYVAVQGRNGATEVVGLPWIEASSWRIVNGRISDISITNWREDFRGPLKTFLANLGATYTQTDRDM